MDGAIGRRALLRGIALGGAATVMGATARSAGRAEPAGNQALSSQLRSPLIFHSPPMRPFADELPRPPVISGDNLTLTASSTLHSFHRDFDPVPALGFNGESYLGPTIEARVGDPLTLTMSNRLREHPFAVDMDTSVHGVRESFRTATPLSLHLHGGVTPPEHDGHPYRMITPGRDIVHHFPNRQHAGPMWYHDHAMGITRMNVYAGLAGMYFLRDEFDTGLLGNPLGIPAEEYEMPLILQEKIFTETGRQSIRSTPIVPEGSWEGGAVGDVGLVNGKVWPTMRVDRGLYRFRVVNAASFSVWNLHFGNRMRFWVIGNEHGLLDAPVPTTAFRLSPGERIDLLVDFSAFREGDSVELCNDEQPPGQAAVLGEVAMPVFCRFTAGARRGFTGAVPQSLRGGRHRPALLPPVETPTVVRNVTISQPYALRIPPAFMTLNNLTFDHPDIEMPRQGTVEQWNIVNVTPDPHPIHLHLVMFRILGRVPLRTLEYQIANPQPPVGTRWTPSAEQFLAGPLAPPAPWEAGWKDTVRADPNSITRIVVRFPTADELGFDPDATFPASVDADAGHVPHPSTQHAHTPEAHIPESGTGTHHHSDVSLQLPGPEHHSPPEGERRLQGYVWHCHILDHEDHEMMLRYRLVN